MVQQRGSASGEKKTEKEHFEEGGKCCAVLRNAGTCERFPRQEKFSGKGKRSSISKGGEVKEGSFPKKEQV